MAHCCWQLQRHSRVSSGSWALPAGLMALSCWQTPLVNDLGQPPCYPACDSHITCAILPTFFTPTKPRLDPPGTVTPCHRLPLAIFLAVKNTTAGYATHLHHRD